MRKRFIKTTKTVVINDDMSFTYETGVIRARSTTEIDIRIVNPIYVACFEEGGCNITRIWIKVNRAINEPAMLYANNGRGIKNHEYDRIVL